MMKVNFEKSAADVKGNIEITVQPINELVAATTRCIDSIRSGSEKVGNMLCNSATVIGNPVGAWFDGKAQEISANSQFIVANIMYKKEINAIKHLQYVAEEFNKKVKNDEQIPEKIEASDNLLLIQDNASTTSNEEFLRLWAKLYTEEACKQGSISRKTIKLLETLDINIIKILENEIFPYCDNNGFYWGNVRGISNLLLLQDYGLIETNPICASSINFNESFNVRLNGNYILCCYPNLACSAIIASQMYRLTNFSLEIVNNVNLHAEISPDDAIQIIYEHINESSKFWNIAQAFYGRFKFKNPLKHEEKFVICDNQNNVIYPKNSPFKTYDEFIKSALDNIEVFIDEE